MATATVNGTVERAKVEVDVTDLYIDDIETLEAFSFGEKRLSECVDILDGIVKGGVRGRKYRATDLKEIIEAVLSAIAGDASEKNSSGGS